MKNRILTIVLFSIFLSGSGDPEAGKDKSYTCSSCHGADASISMKGISVTYPKYSAEDGKLRALQHQITHCRTKNMEANAWKWESDEMLGMSAFIKNKSKGIYFSCN